VRSLGAIGPVVWVPRLRYTSSMTSRSAILDARSIFSAVSCAWLVACSEGPELRDTGLTDTGPTDTGLAGTDALRHGEDAPSTAVDGAFTADTAPGQYAGSGDDAGVPAGECDLGECAPTCFRAVTCVTACGGPETACGCCACAAGSFDAIGCGM
jgi:hypothetical protein